MKFRSKSPEFGPRCCIFVDVGVVVAGVAEAAAAAGSAIASGAAAVGSGIGAAAGAVGDVAGTVGGAIASGAGAVGDAAGAAGSAIGSGISSAGTAIGNFAGTTAGQIGSGLSTLGSGISSALGGSGNAAGAVASDTANASSTSEGALSAGLKSVSDTPPTAAQIAQQTMSRAASSPATSTSAFSDGLQNFGNKLAKKAMDNPFTTIGLVGQGIAALTQPRYQMPSNLMPGNMTPTPMPSVARGLSPNYQATTPYVYSKPAQPYAPGGLVGPTAETDYDTPVDINTGEPTGFAAGGPVNKFYAMGVQQAQTKQAQAQQAQAQQAQAQQAPASSPFASAQGGTGITGYARGRMVNGPGDGVSDGIPAMIDGNEPAALASQEYVIPARAVSELGNGSSAAGAKRLDKMVADIQRRRSKTLGKKGIAVDSKAYRAMPV